MVKDFAEKPEKKHTVYVNQSQPIQASKTFGVCKRGAASMSNALRKSKEGKKVKTMLRRFTATERSNPRELYKLITQVKFNPRRDPLPI